MAYDTWHLPEFMRDFHDQKDIFRAIDDYDRDCLRPADERQRHPSPDWMTAHVYTVDVFLRFMAEHGYTLQRSRKQHVAFRDTSETVRRSRAARLSSSGAVLKQMLRQSETPT